MPCAQSLVSLVSLLVTSAATVWVPRFRTVLIRLSRPVPVLRHLRTGSGLPGGLASDRWLSGGLGAAGGLTACCGLSEVLLTRVRLAADWRLSGMLWARVR